MADVVIDTDVAARLQKGSEPAWVRDHVLGARTWLTFVTPFDNQTADGSLKGPIPDILSGVAPHLVDVRHIVPTPPVRPPTWFARPSEPGR